MPLMVQSYGGMAVRGRMDLWSDPGSMNRPAREVTIALNSKAVADEANPSSPQVQANLEFGDPHNPFDHT